MLTTPPLPFSLYGLEYEQLEGQLREAGVAAFHARALWQALYRGENAPLLPPPARWLAAVAPSAWPLPVEMHESSDGLTRKLLLQLDDGERIECVLMRYRDRYTACLSTQAGCAMGCRFCATGQGGFRRHLRVEEIVGQVLLLRRWLESEGAALRNLVLMGMGEPLHNFDAVMAALGIVTDRRGLGIAPRHVAVSTVGVIPGILRMAREKVPYRLAVSLHGASEEERAALVPVSRRWPLRELLEACRVYNEATGSRILFGWTLIAGVNDTPAHAEQLAALLQGLNAHINLIPLNPTEGFAGAAPDRATWDRFQMTLHRAGFPNTVRQKRGVDVAAACGQLAGAV